MSLPIFRVKSLSELLTAAASSSLTSLFYPQGLKNASASTTFFAYCFNYDPHPLEFLP